MRALPLDNEWINQYLFSPHQTRCPHPFWVNAEGAELCCSYVENAPVRKTVVHFHGNGETVSDFEDLHTIYNTLGLNSLLAEYRGYGESTGIPSLGAILRDVEPILKAVPDTCGGIILHGRSFGAIPAIRGTASDQRVCGLILEMGIAEVSSFGVLSGLWNLIGIDEHEVSLWEKRHFDHEGRLARYRGATLIMHCQNDTLVPVVNAHKLYDWCHEPKYLRLFDEGDHNTFLSANFSVYLRASNKIS